MLMIWNKYHISILIMLLVQSLHAQHMELGLQSRTTLAHSSGAEMAMNGWDLSLSYSHHLDQDIFIRGGMEWGYAGWGGQMLFVSALAYGQKNQAELEILNGMALYRQKNSYIFAAGVRFRHLFFHPGRNKLILSAGFRYSIQPAYKDYSGIYSYLDFPIRISWARMLHRD